MLTGHVIDVVGGCPVSAVVVSNGHESVRTDVDGQYELPDRYAGEGYPCGAHVMISTPTGYCPVDGWYRSASDSNVVFHLSPDLSRSGNSFTFAQLADMHLGKYPYEWLADDLHAIAEGNGVHPPVQCIALVGDMTQSGLAEEYTGYLAACAESTLPMIHVPGNHEWIGNRESSRWAELMGPLYFSLNWGPVHIVCYESTARLYRPDLPQDKWLKGDLALVPRDAPVIMLIHDQFEEEFHAQWRTNRIVATFSGHWHSSRLYDDGHTVHVNQPSSTMGGIDYSARGYTVARIDSNGDVSLFRRLLGTTQRGRCTGVTSVPEPPPRYLLPNVPSVQLGEAWPQFHGGPERRGYRTSPVVLPFTRVWQTCLPGGIHFGSAVIADDAVYIATLNEEDPHGGMLVCLDATSGHIHWQAPTDGSVKHTPAVWEHLVIATTVTGHVRAVDRTTGRAVWVHQLGDPSRRWVFNSPLVVNDRVFVGAAHHFAALDAATGQCEWTWLRDDQRRTDWISSYSSGAADNRNIYVGFFWQYEVAWAFDQATGDVRWTIEEPTRASPVGTPALGEDGVLYNICHDATVRAHSCNDGCELWRFDLEQREGVRGGPRWSAGSPALADGRLYVPTGDGAVRALDVDTGTQVWEWWSGPAAAGVQAYTRNGRSVLSSPVVVGNLVIVGASDGRIVALDSVSGELLWYDDLEAPVISSPAISGNLVVCAASDGWLYGWTGQDS